MNVTFTERDMAEKSKLPIKWCKKFSKFMMLFLFFTNPFQAKNFSYWFLYDGNIGFQ